MGRRRWSADARARILEETLVPGAIVSMVARRHGLSPQQLFTWRREARKRAVAAEPLFVPAVIAPEPPRDEARQAKRRRREPVRCAAAIELEVAGVTVRIADGTAPATIMAVIRALKAQA